MNDERSQPQASRPVYSAEDASRVKILNSRLLKACMKNSIPSSLVTALACVLTIAGCAQLPPTPAAVASPTPVVDFDRCTGLNAMSDADTAARLDIAPVVLVKLRTASGQSNEQVCALPQAEINRIMLADLNKYRNADRKTFRAPAKEFILQWDMDDQGKLPNSSQNTRAIPVFREKTPFPFQFSCNTQPPRIGLIRFVPAALPFNTVTSQSPIQKSN